ncbi:hypothetical protein GJ744_002916 [Endocarpon pusillum]|uniref:Uncharacterized protein n=1 Tax=Endocarpon pusillum TaxID=364733 RepID=A0A8H7A7I2_9EURO|nr:hypothetical protein GJ744_002916 [Endocarpon pusillum]
MLPFKLIYMLGFLLTTCVSFTSSMYIHAQASTQTPKSTSQGAVRPSTNLSVGEVRAKSEGEVVYARRTPTFDPTLTILTTTGVLLPRHNTPFPRCIKSLASTMRCFTTTQCRALEAREPLPLNESGSAHSTSTDILTFITGTTTISHPDSVTSSGIEIVYRPTETSILVDHFNISGTGVVSQLVHTPYHLKDLMVSPYTATTLTNFGSVSTQRPRKPTTKDDEIDSPVPTPTPTAITEENMPSSMQTPLTKSLPFTTVTTWTGTLSLRIGSSISHTAIPTAVTHSPSAPGVIFRHSSQSTIFTACQM